MSNSPKIKTAKPIYPQIYAYTLPEVPKKDGWVKIGYTERKNVDDRIKEQTLTARLTYEKLWDAPAIFIESGEQFTDKRLHDYLIKHKQIKRFENSEWFFYEHNLKQRSYADYESFLANSYDQAKEKAQYQLRDEQAAAVAQTMHYIKSYPKGEFLWNAKPRFGKTLTTYDLARQIDATKVLIVTNRPSIANSWFDDFEKFIAWQSDFAFVSTSDSLSERPVLTREQFLSQTASGKKNMIAFISLQDLKGAISFGGNYNKLGWVKDMTWDMLVIDEAHEGVDTLKTDLAFDNIDRDFTLHLSGTPFKAVAAGIFNEDEIYNWSYADEQNAKATWDNPDEHNPYEKLPRLNLFSYQMGQAITDEVNKGAKIEGENIDYAFDLNEFFETQDNGKFVHEADVKKWLDSLSRNEKYPFSTKALRDELKHTFWLLNRIASAKALQKLLREHPVFENYEIILAAGDGQGHDSAEIISDKSLVRVREAVQSHDKTITLSVGQLTTGITIPEWTAVLMLSNIKSPSLYMQAAFRAQNPWEYKIDDQVYQKENAYVFDFAPERTLIIYEEFANDLSRRTVNGGGTSDDRKENIKHLLNFFPVIAEDSDGSMVELDATQVLTIPKAIKAQEVVRRGFMSNLLFKNVSGIFASQEVREILENLNPVEVGKNVLRKTQDPIDTQDVTVDSEGEAQVDADIVISETEARFGEKTYANIQSTVDTFSEQSQDNHAKAIEKSFIDNVAQGIKEAAKDNGVTQNFAENIVNNAAKAVAREVEISQRQTDIKQKEAEVEYEQEVSRSHLDEVKIADAKAAYEAKQIQIQEDYQKEVAAKVAAKTQEQIQASNHAILQKAEDKKKNTVEDDVRARLRGFARTIPSFLMAYGEIDTVIENFDKRISENVFKEVTGITLDQFRTLRDKFNFFDETVFNESVQEFLKKRTQLANYFDESQDEDIFDYIPPQQTNQIFTPRKVVKMMVDILEEENPDIFSDSSKTFADLYVKSGLYLTEIVRRLYVGLANEIPDDNVRLKHILENQIYGFAPSEIIYNIARNFVFGFDESAKVINSSHIVCLDTTPYAKGDDDFKSKCNELFGDKK
ncbi:DEAD/DEAH box helicase [Psychrobacter immobilis]|uniref:DEAD/DEAH box helicase n=1 Tax=Psychrobacter immobilis TaxID=498 RepID=UPI001918B89D|nr:DEAD/DEAH box helicase family protein [Psychrobacter immobilis]